MRTRTKTAIAAIVATSAALALVGVAGSPSAEADNAGRAAVGLTGNGTALVAFDTTAPTRTTALGRVTGLSNGDTHLVGIDYRVQNGKLYGVGNQGGIYTLNDTTATATRVGALTTGLSGNRFDIDFNPAANALRIITDTGHNLRQPFAATGDAPNGATVSDQVLNYTGGNSTGVTAAAYTNNDLNADTATTLYDIDTNLDQVALQSPANTGLLAATGKLGINADADAGFDIHSAKDATGRTQLVAGYATLGVNGAYSLYSINLITGQATRIGAFGSAVTDLAVKL